MHVRAFASVRDAVYVSPEDWPVFDCAEGISHVGFRLMLISGPTCRRQVFEPDVRHALPDPLNEKVQHGAVAP